MVGELDVPIDYGQQVTGFAQDDAGVDLELAHGRSPDGHVAWVGGGAEVGLADALTTWFGAARQSARTSD